MRPSALCLCLAIACGRNAETEPAGTAKTLRCAPVRAQPVRDFVELRGTVAPLPDRDAQVAPQVAGRILRVEVREGDRVTAGQLVARVDDAPLVDAADEADAAVARARAERQNAETTRARVERVFEHGIAARQEVEDAAAREAVAKAAEAGALAAARVARRQLERAAVRSPLAGVVLKVMRRPGELVDGTPATPVLEVADPSRLELVVDAPATDLVRIARGAVAALVVPALPSRVFSGTVSVVSPSVDRATGIGVVRIAIDLDPSTAPPVGTYGVAWVQTGEPRAVTVVPAAALRAAMGEEAEVVVCGDDGAAHVRRVHRGGAHEGAVEVRGVAAGERVAVEPVLGVEDNDPIQVVP